MASCWSPRVTTPSFAGTTPQRGRRRRENRDFLLETFVLAFTADGKQLLAGGADARITFFDTSTG